MRGGGNGAVREDRDQVVGNLDEAAIDVVTLRLAVVADAQFAEAEPADERRPAGGDAGFTIEQRQRDELARRIERPSPRA